MTYSLPLPYSINKDWLLLEKLGEGAFANVRRMVCKRTNSAYALKLIDLKKNTNTEKSAKKEACILKLLCHPNIVEFYQTFMLKHDEQIFQCIVLELITGGELFHQIPQNVGISISQARLYFNQILDGVEYIHSCGIAHRDLKPENILISVSNNSPCIKISDFGMATVFMIDGKQRMLNKECGSLAYMAPEVTESAYFAQPADIWSIGMILVLMLTGTKPWTEATKFSTKYMKWTKNEISDISPWNRLDEYTLSFLRKILNPYPMERLTIPQIKDEDWCCSQYMSNINKISSVPVDNTMIEALTRMCSFIETTPSPIQQYEQNFNFNILSSPQLIEAPEVYSKLSTNIIRTPYEKYITRCLVKSDVFETLRRLISVCSNFEWTWKVNDFSMTVSSLNRENVTFKINISEFNGNTLIDIRLSSGCVLEFKRNFFKIKESKEILQVLLPS
ncbi:hypothetical protein PVAND_001159 [Polypedilum vanderplanki]|uniref:non-specific serine/threonine protein kinase n=1 Tax=Polypedilum vanderplanki TaxID=319348 RepID=A0A9J6BMD3_POLVA|nr:hypothetical protein PVAND_001159 [Polypedilum vanderplanki]